MSFSKVGLVGTGIIGEALIEVLLRSGHAKESLFIAEVPNEEMKLSLDLALVR